MRVLILFHPNTSPEDRRLLGQIETTSRGAWSSMANYPSSNGHICQFVSSAKEISESCRKHYDGRVLRMIDRGIMVVLFEFCHPRSDFGKYFEQDLVGVLGRAFGGRFGMNVRPMFKFLSETKDEQKPKSRQKLPVEYLKEGPNNRGLYDAAA